DLYISFVPSHRANEPRPVPYLYAGIGSLLIEHAGCELVRFFIRCQVDIVRPRERVDGVAEINSIGPDCPGSRTHVRHRRDSFRFAGARPTSLPAAGVFSQSLVRGKPSQRWQEW